MSSFLTAAIVMGNEAGKAAAAENTQKMIDAGQLPARDFHTRRSLQATHTSKAEADKLEEISKSEKLAKEMCDKNAAGNMIGYTLSGAAAGATVCGVLTRNKDISLMCATGGAALGSFQAQLKSEVECLDIRNRVVKEE